MLEMEHLPDDVLLKLMSYLDVADLLQCCLVCKRLAPLARHADVWRHRDVSWTSRCTRLRHRALFAALRLAPCVHSLEILLPPLPQPGLQLHTLFTAPCAARRLTLTLREELGAWQASLLIRHQSALGRLREIDLRICCKFGSQQNDSAPPVAPVLFWTLASTSGLDALKITGDLRKGDMLDAPAPSTVVASLTRFECLTRDQVDCDAHWLEPFTNAVLATHAATLTDVRVVSLGRPCPSPLTAPLLASMPHLTMLKCQMLPGMEAVAACADLRSVELRVDPDMGAALRSSTASFFRLAHQLRHVSIWCSEFRETGEFVSAMAASGRSCVETVCVDNLDFLDWLQAARLSAAVRGLPALRLLKIKVGAYSEDARRTLLTVANNSLRVHLCAPHRTLNHRTLIKLFHS